MGIRGGVLITRRNDQESDLARALLKDREVKFQEIDAEDIRNLRYTPPYLSVPLSGRLYQGISAIVYATDIEPSL
jgi:hypothetical protein